MDKPVFDKGLVLPNKLICLSKTRVSNALRSPRYANAQPRSNDKIANAPPPGTDNVSKCPAVARGGGWAPLELIDAVLVRLVYRVH